MSMRNYNDGQEVVMEDFNAASKAILREIYDRGLFEVLQRSENAFFEDSLQVVYSNTTTLICKKGLGFQTDALAVSPDPKRKPLVLDADKALTITPPHASLDRIDIVVVKAAIVDELTGQRNYKDAADGSVSLQNFVLQKDWQANVILVEGTPNADPVEPAVPAGYMKIASVYVTAITGILNTAAITDSRTKFPIGSGLLINTTGFHVLTNDTSISLLQVLSEIDSLLKDNGDRLDDAEGFIEDHEDRIAEIEATLSDVAAVGSKAVGTKDTQTLENKTLVTPVTDVVTISNQTTPATPAAGKKKMYAKSNGILYILDENGVETPVGSNAVAADPAAFYKLDSTSCCLFKTAAATLSIKAGTRAIVNGALQLFAIDTAVTMPSLTAGTDYAVYICDDGSVVADANFSAPTGYTTTTSRKIGGFHYGLVGTTETVAGGSFATTGNGMIWQQADVNNIRGINQFSLWDLKFRPNCEDPRGMVLVAGKFWVDIYLCNNAPEANGTSKYNTGVASGTVLPKIPTMFGGNGTTAYSNMNWFAANEIAKAFGKRLMRHEEFVVSAFGVTENQSIGTGAVSTTTGQALGSGSNTIAFTGRVAGYTSKWGLEQATGHHYTWGADSAGVQGTAWQNQTDGRGQIYGTAASPIYVLFGGDRGLAANSGSRCSLWHNYAWNSTWSIGLRAACDHLKLA